MFLGLPVPHPDPIVKGMDPDTDLYQIFTDPQHLETEFFSYYYSNIIP
jgi:hypothetical protein